MKKTKEEQDLINKKFGMLTVLYKDEIRSKEKRKPYWWCECSCENKTLISVLQYSLFNGNTTSCGCKRNKSNRERCKKYNTYDLNGNYGIGYTEEGKEFWFDLEDYDKIKKYYWNFNDSGYVVTKTSKGGTLRFHRIIFDLKNNSMQVDHIYHKKYDNRKSQLRLTSNQKNSMNSSMNSNNTTGRTGVYYNKTSGNWYAQIKVNYKIIHLGSFNKFEEAVKARKKAEDKYFGEYSYENSMNKEEKGA